MACEAINRRCKHQHCADGIAYLLIVRDAADESVIKFTNCSAQLIDWT